MNPTGGSLTSYLNDPSLTQARTQAQTTQQSANTAQEADITLPDMLRSALSAKLTTNNPQFADRESALSDYLTATKSAPLSVMPQNNGGIIYTPEQQASLIQDKIAPSLAHLATANSILGLTTGGLDNIIGVASRAHQAQTQQLTDSAKLAQTNYQDILNELSQKADLAYKQMDLGMRYANMPQVVSQNLVGDVKSGMTLKDALSKYAGKLDPDQIYQIYNNASPYGAAKENIGQLATLGIKSPINIQTQGKLNDIATSANAIQQLESTLNRIPTYEGLGGLVQGSLLRGKAATGYQSDVSAYEALVNGLASQIAKGIGRESGNLSTGDVERAKSLLPKVTDPTSVRQAKLANLNALLKANENYFGTQYGAGIPTGPTNTGTSSGGVWQ